MSFSEHRYASHDGLSLYYREYGSGSNVVMCLPGLTRNCKDFRDVAEHLAGRYRVITPDLRGRGQSDRDPKWSNYRPGVYVRDIWALLDLMQVDRAALIGTSLGGLMSMIMAYQDPQRIRGMVINDIGPEIPDNAVARILEYASQRLQAPSLEEAAVESRRNYSLAFPDVGDDFWLDYIGRSWTQTPAGYWERDMDPAIGSALRKAYRLARPLRCLRRTGLIRQAGGAPIDLWDAFAAVTMPLMLVHGTLSDVLRQATIDQMQLRKPGMQVVSVPKRGHAPLLNEPGVLNAIDRFLESLN